MSSFSNLTPSLNIPAQITLTKEEYYYPTVDDRLGVFTLKDPCSAVHKVRDKPFSMFSSTSFSDAPEILSNATFDELKFTYEFQVTLCDVDGEMYNWLLFYHKLYYRCACTCTSV